MNAWEVTTPPPRQRVAPPIARAIDRLARRAHAFHRFAHHPLCDRYASELITLGRRRRVCRGCIYACTGALLGVCIGLALPLSANVFSAASVLSLFAVGGAAMSVGRHAAKSRALRARRSKLWTRALPSAGLSCALALSLRIHDAPALTLALALVAAIATLHASYRRRGPDRSPCVHCPERHEPVPCSGFRDIVRAERAFVRRSRALLDSRGARHADARMMP